MGLDTFTECLPLHPFCTFTKKGLCRRPTSGWTCTLCSTQCLGTVQPTRKYSKAQCGTGWSPCWTVVINVTRHWARPSSRRECQTAWSAGIARVPTLLPWQQTAQQSKAFRCRKMLLQATFLHSSEVKASGRKLIMHGKSWGWLMLTHCREIWGRFIMVSV